MSRELFGVEKGFRIYKENSETEFIDQLFGSGLPGGDSGEQDAAPVGSMYYRQSGAGSTIFQKIASANNAADWKENGSTAIQLGFRNEKIRAVTSENVLAGVRDLVASPFTDDDGTTLVAADFNVGEFLISNSAGVAVLLEITAISAPNITLSAPGSAPALAEFDTFLTPNYLPDVDGQENQALVQINSAGSIAKVGDVDWEFATGINLSGAYAAASGDVSSADSVESAIEKLDGNVDALNSSLGTAQGATDMGVYTGNVISDNVGQSTVNQELESAIEANQPNIKIGTVALNTPTSVDSVLVDEIQAVKWLLTARETANPANVKTEEILAMHDGHGAADANDADDSVIKLRIGNFNLKANAKVSGVGVAQTMFLELDTTEAGGITYSVERLHEVALLG